MTVPDDRFRLARAAAAVQARVAIDIAADPLGPRSLVDTEQAVAWVAGQLTRMGCTAAAARCNRHDAPTYAAWVAIDLLHRAWPAPDLDLEAGAEPALLPRPLEVDYWRAITIAAALGRGRRR